VRGAHLSVPPSLPRDQRRSLVTPDLFRVTRRTI
jgi:hypothetical protein